jgi:hypothetical protein
MNNDDNFAEALFNAAGTHFIIMEKGESPVILTPRIFNTLEDAQKVIDGSRFRGKAVVCEIKVDIKAFHGL